MKTRRVRLIAEIISFSVFMGFPLLVLPTMKAYLISENQINPVLTGIVITHSLLILFYYFNSYFALPKFYFTGKYKAYIAMVVSSLVAIVLVMQINKEHNPLAQHAIKFSSLIFIFSIFARFVMIFLLSLGFANYQRLKEAEQEKLKTELSYLKAQINPHFLFNTLNSVYALAVKKSDTAPEAITKLSGIMRYVITDAAQEYVSLDKEIDYITNYIELEELRLTSKVSLSFKATGVFTGKKIAPLIFVPFIENAFKHGVSTRENSTLQISIVVEGNELSLLVKNTKVNTHAVSTGLGIENAKKRLNLLYPAKHKLAITNLDTDYTVSLKINLND